MNELVLNSVADAAGPETAEEDSVQLTYEARRKVRQRVALDSGREALVSLPRGTVLRDGDVLLGEDATRVRVTAAPEPVSVVCCRESRALARAAYHLGNRHVQVQVDQDRLIYLHDHVLDAMLAGLGFEVRRASAAFEPEAGAYAAGHPHSHHGAGHGHDHGGPRLHVSEPHGRRR